MHHLKNRLREEGQTAAPAGPPAPLLVDEEQTRPIEPASRSPLASLADELDALLPDPAPGAPGAWSRSEAAPPASVASDHNSAESPTSSRQAPSVLAPPATSRPGPVTSVDIANTILRHAMQRLEEPKELPEKQKRAIELLLAGKTYTHIADALGIDRATLWRWRNKDADFRRGLEQAREDAYRDAGARLRELVPRALQVLEFRLAKDDYQAAVRVLRLARIDGEQPARTLQARTSLMDRLRRSC
jgi:hypothetical protein